MSSTSTNSLVEPVTAPLASIPRSTPRSECDPLLWWTGLAIGVFTQLFFLWTAWNLYLFLRDGGTSDRPFSWGIDLGLALFFAWPHSLLLAPFVQKKLKNYFPGAWLGLVHCLATCVSLWFLFLFWTRSSSTLWDLEGVSRTGMQIGFYGSWIALFYSLYLTGMGYQTGLTPWWYWLRGKALPRRAFVTTGAFRYMRHPVYLSFLGLIWFTPQMTVDHAILTVVWTIYIYVGSYLKDRRLEHFLGRHIASMVGA